MRAAVTLRAGGTAHWTIRLASTLLVGVVLVWIPTKGSNGFVTEVSEAFSLMCAAMALNLLTGFTGQISLGHSAFFGIGAYATGVSVSRFDIHPLATFPIAFAFAFAVGVVVSFPASRIKGVYLGLVTLALALVFPAVLRWHKLAWLTGSGTGLPIADTARVPTTGFDIGRRDGQIRTYEILGWDPFGDLRSGDGRAPFHYWIGLAVVVFVYLVCRGIVKSRAGRSMIAVRDNEAAAAVMGVNLIATKAFVFGISAGLCALGGSFSAIRVGSVSPDSVTITLIGALTFLVVMVIGGAGSLWGPVVGTAVYVFVTNTTGGWSEPDEIPSLVRPLFAWSEVPPGTGILAVVLIALMFVAPRGVVGLWNDHVPRVVRIAPRATGRTSQIDRTVTAPGGLGADGDLRHTTDPGPTSGPDLSIGTNATTQGGVHP